MIFKSRQTNTGRDGKAHSVNMTGGAGHPPFCSCGFVGGLGIQGGRTPFELRPLLAHHIRDAATSPSNPILVAFREYTIDYKTASALSDEASLWAHDVQEEAEGYQIGGPQSDSFDQSTPEQIDHAIRVLTRLAAIEAKR